VAPTGTGSVSGTKGEGKSHKRFLGVFAKLLKISVCPSAYPSTRTKTMRIPLKRIFMKFDTNIFRNIVEKSEFSLMSSNMKADRGSSVAKVLCYKSGGRWFDPS